MFVRIALGFSIAYGFVNDSKNNTFRIRFDLT